MAESGSFLRSLARLNALWFGTSVATTSGLGLGLATLVLVIVGGPQSRHLNLLAQYLPGYRVSFGGAVVGALWGAALGFLFSFPAAWVYYRDILVRIHANDGPAQGAPGETVARLHLPTLSLAGALLCGTLVWLATTLLLVSHRSGEPLGPHLGLLAQVLPGYSVSFAGSLVGFAYFALLGMAAACSVGWLYNSFVSGERRVP